MLIILFFLSDFNSLHVVNLRMQCVQGAGPPSELRKLFPNIMELDISKNLLSSWNDVFDICSQLDHLHWLMVSENLMEMPEDISRWKFPNMRVLTCGKAELTWADVIKLMQVFPNIEELRVPSNKISSLELPDNHNFKNLKLFDIENNPIENWKEVNKLGKLPKLQLLYLEKTGLETIELPSKTGKSDCFKDLKKLVLSENKIDKVSI